MATSFIQGDYRYTVDEAVEPIGTIVGVQVTDTTKSSYADMPSNVTYGGKTYKVQTGNSCFSGCTNLVSAPALSSNLTSLAECFADCTSLVNAPVLPNSALNLTLCFRDCTSLVSAPVIPRNVIFLTGCFDNCTALTGEVIINANTVERPYNMFARTQKGIWLTGSSSQLQVLADTATRGNVFVGEIPLSGSLTAERVSANGGTTPDPEGEWALLTLNIAWSDFQANSIDRIQASDDGSYMSVIWYEDLEKTTPVVLPDWRPASSTTVYCWLRIDESTHTIQVNISDGYHTGKPMTIIVPATFRTVDFLAGGKGIAFGKVAEHEGFECAMDAFAQSWVGFIQMFAGSTPPNGWKVCDGSELLVSDYPELFAAIRNTYGTPSDSDHFVLPNLQGRFPIGVGSSYPLGDTGGSANAIVPYHRHSVSAVANAITGGSHHHATYRKKNAGSGSAIYVPDGGSTSNGISTTDTSHTHNLPAHNTNYEGESLVGKNIPPYLGINFIIHTGRPTISA